MPRKCSAKLEPTEHFFLILPRNSIMESESPPARTTILSTFLRGRPRNSSQSFAGVENSHARELSPPPVNPPSPAPNPRARRQIASNNNNGTPGQLQPSASQPQQSTGLVLSQMLRRRRSAGNVHNNNNNNQNNNHNQAQAQTQQHPHPPHNSQTTQTALTLGLAPAAAQTGAMNAANTSATPLPQPAQTTPANPNTLAHRIRLVPHLDTRRSLRFDPIGRDLREGDPALRIGRFTDRSGLGLAAINSVNSNKLAFRSKVVSRAHAEIWVEAGGKFFIRDTKSSSGTFLNHVRLSAANAESRPFQIKDGDILQLGVDYQGGAEDIYKSVKIRIEIGREWQAGANAFNTNAFKNLKALATPVTNGAGLTTGPSTNHGKNKSLGIPDCCICLFSVTIRQALFIAPCSHTFHYKCIRPILDSHHPSFSCPLCRTYADLDEDVEVDEASWEIEVSGAENDDDANKADKDNVNAAVESVLSAVGAVSGATGAAGGGVSDGGEDGDREGDDRMDIDQDERADEGVHSSHRSLSGATTPNDLNHLSPPHQSGAISGEEDVDSDVGAHQQEPLQATSGTAAPINSNNPFASNASLGAANAPWASPGAGSSTSARGDSPIPLNLGGPGPVAVVVSAVGEADDTEIGVVDGIEGETVSGKRKR
ncbi:putative E3 ubiquitin-protein ligase dma1 [Leucoagaricus sp. SymC.cos]|nr:putative E3 ubiquitin-protein ligase dma1 [Leucoagaricus sp. SymC.cos]